MDTLSALWAASPWGQIVFVGVLVVTSGALGVLARSLWQRDRSRGLLAASGALALLTMTTLHVVDAHRVRGVEQHAHHLRLQVQELQHTLTLTQGVRDHLTAELEMAQTALGTGRQDLVSLLTRVEQSLTRTTASLDQAKAELTMARRDEALEPAPQRTLDDRLDAVLREIDRLGSIRARPTVRLEARRPDVSQDPVAILPSTPDVQSPPRAP